VTRRRTASARAVKLPKSEARSYWTLSMRPLHVLVFLAPLLVAFEVGSILYLMSSDHTVAKTIQAYKLLGDFFELFGAAGRVIPAVTLVTVLIVWHVMRRDPWTIYAGVVGGMVLESVLWTLPLLVMAGVQMRTAGGSRGGMAAWSGPGSDLTSMTWQARVTISIGAGLYEELLFRFVAIALAHMLLADLLRMSKLHAAIGAVVVSALLFALYHDAALASGGTDWARLVFLFAAGVYLGVLYASRGLGIVAATHAMYDVLVLVVLRAG
jgi:membrane protease YdiL (CAAX protease family)